MTSKWESDHEVDEEHWKLVLENILTLQSKEQHKDTTRTFETMKVMLKQKYPAKVLNKVMKQIRGMAETTHFRAFVCAVQGMYKCQLGHGVSNLLDVKKQGFWSTSLKAFSHQRRAKPFNTLRSKADSFEKSHF